MRQVLFALFVLSGSAWAGDWPQFLGPQRDGTSSEQGLATHWPVAGPPRLWAKSVGEGYKIGCPSRAMVVIEEGNAPRPVRLKDLDPTGGATAADNAEAARVNEAHKPVKEAKEAERKRKLKN